MEAVETRRRTGKDQIWCAYNHMPGGHIVVTHFEPYSLHQKQGGDKTREVHFSAEDQLEGHRRSEHVALNINGKIEKNKVLEFEGGDLRKEPRAADVVIEFAKSKGMLPIRRASEEEPKQGVATLAVNKQTQDRVAKLEDQVSGLDGKLDKALQALDILTKQMIAKAQAERKDGETQT